ncbi:MAG: hypothetical protein KatS3mg114_0656 [Planctomycetaceae bacterium]|nr:MAG: hypothetical protein KatS3mg114_0656 [Planctomycetaceae bacterium]
MGPTLMASIGAEEGVQEKVRQMLHGSRSERITAARALEQDDPAAVLTALPDDSSVADAELRDLLSRLRKILERRWALRIRQGSRVSWRDDLPLDAALARLQATGNRVHLDEGISAVEVTPAPAENALLFWEAVERLRLRTQTDLRWDAENRGWRLAAVKSHSSSYESPMLRADSRVADKPIFVAVCGPYRLELISEGWGRDEQQGHTLWQAAIRVQSETLIQPWLLRLHPAEWQVLGSQGTWAAWNPQAQWEYSFDDAGEVSARLTFVAKSGARLREVHGRGFVHAALGQEVFRWSRERWSQGGVVRRGELTVRFSPVRLEASPQELHAQQVAEFRVRLAYSRGTPAFESYRAGWFARQAHLRTAEAELPWLDYETLAHVDGGLELRYRAQAASSQLEQATLELTLPTFWLDVPWQARWSIQPPLVAP